jgi:apoptosis-inducing factor 3
MDGAAFGKRLRKEGWNNGARWAVSAKVGGYRREFGGPRMLEKPDLAAGISLQTLEEGRALVGHVGEETVFVLRTGSSIAAFGASCTHLGGPLEDGLVDGGQALCPWHHACFDLRTGKALTAPAFNPLQQFKVDLDHGKVVVSKQASSAAEPVASPSIHADSGQVMTIVGGGAAGFAAAHTLREKGWRGRIAMYSADENAPYDRTLLTKDYLDGNFGDDQLEIAKDRFAKLAVDLALETPVQAIDIRGKALVLPSGRSKPYHKLLLATGSTPKALEIPGADQSQVQVLRTLADCRRLLAAASKARRILVIGSSFIGLEAAASLRSRGLSVHVVGPHRHPMEKLLGRGLSELILDTLKSKGIEFALGRKPARLAGDSLILDNGDVLPADAILAGIGVVPNTDLAHSAGLRVDDGVVVDGQLRTSHPDIYAAGDIASWPDRISGQRIRVEHWVVAERQGQIAAANMLGADQEFAAVPFFWSKFFDLSFSYVGHAKDWDEVTIEGDLRKWDAVLRYSKDGKDLAVATVGRDRDALLAERAFEARLNERAAP